MGRLAVVVAGRRPLADCDCVHVQSVTVTVPAWEDEHVWCGERCGEGGRIDVRGRERSGVCCAYDVSGVCCVLMYGT